MAGGVLYHWFCDFLYQWFMLVCTNSWWCSTPVVCGDLNPWPVPYFTDGSLFLLPMVCAGLHQWLVVFYTSSLWCSKHIIGAILYRWFMSFYTNGLCWSAPMVCGVLHQ